MGKRLGRKRLYALNKMGQSFTGSAVGRGISGAVGTRVVHRNGYEVMTEIYVDLGTSKGQAPTSMNTLGKIIAVSSSTDGEPGSTAQPASLLQVKSAVHGKVQLVEMHCVEAPQGGGTDIDIRFASYGTGSFSGSVDGGQALDGDGAWVEGETIVAEVDTNALEDQFLYLTTGASNGAGAVSTYTHGKYLIRLFGNITPKDLTNSNKTGEDHLG